MQCITKRPDDINPTETHRTLNKLFLVNANNHTVYCIIYEFEYFIVSFPGIFQKKLLIHPHYIGYIVEVILCRFEGCAFIRSCHLYHSSKRQKISSRKSRENFINLSDFFLFVNIFLSFFSLQPQKAET